MPGAGFPLSIRYADPGSKDRTSAEPVRNDPSNSQLKTETPGPDLSPTPGKRSSLRPDVDAGAPERSAQGNVDGAQGSTDAGRSQQYLQGRLFDGTGRAWFATGTPPVPFVRSGPGAAELALNDPFSLSFFDAAPVKTKADADTQPQGISFSIPYAANSGVSRRADRPYPAHNQSQPFASLFEKGNDGAAV